MKQIFLYIFILISIAIKAQGYNYNCATEIDTTEVKNNCERYKANNWDDKLLLMDNFIPINDTFPIVTIKFNVHIWREDNGTGNRWLDTEEYRDSLRIMFNYANYIASHNKQYTNYISNALFIHDTKFRYELDSVYYYNNSDLAHTKNNYRLNQYIKNNHPERLNNFAFHFNLYNDNYASAVSSGINSDIQSFIFLNCYSGHYTGLWADALLMTHEIGHNFGLNHTYDTEITDITHHEYLWDLFGHNQQPWCNNDNPNKVCYHDVGWDCVIDSTTTCTNNIMGGNKNAGHFTALQCGRIHRALRIANIRNHAYAYTEIPHVINEDENWDFNYKSYQDIIINPNVTLTISCQLEMVSQARIIIKPGGRLVIDGGIITKALHEGQWQGIEVWGVDTLHQFIVDGRYQQGYLELKNGATIENAICAVELWQPGNYHSEGGIIHATDAVFRNNAKAVHAINYTNYVPTNGNSSSYNSWFKNCQFIVDSDYIGDETFHKHIDLDRVNGISFKGCSFSANRNVSNVASTATGIAAYSAGFSVDAYCEGILYPCPDEDLVRSSFSGFYSGIHTTNNASSARTFSVRSSTFTNNDMGIYAENTGYATILKNDFNVGTNAGCNFGIYVSEVTSFCIEENNFHGNLQSTNDTYGIAVHNSNNYNSIYLNHFNNLTCGNIAIGNNKSPGIVSLSQSGIAYYCNTNTGNINDFYVIKDNSVSVNGIARSQGSSAEAAGNTFSGSQYHFYNDGDDVINYYYSLSKYQQPHGDKLYRVTAIAANDGNDCSSHYGNNPVVKSEEEMTVLNNDYQTSLSAYNSLEQLYTSRIDGGDTQAELLDINTATADDASRLRSQLLGLSPYLSQEVLTTAASRNDVFSTSTLFEILSANPDELKKDTLISYLENKDNPMPEYMTELLREIANGSTARTALESQMAKSEREYILAAGDIVRSNLNSEESDNEELRQWLGNMNDMASDRLAIATYIQESDFENALALAETLPDVYGLQGTELEEHNDYISILRLYETLDESGRDIMQLTETETEMLEEIADSGSGSSQSMAYAILSQNNETLVTAVNCPVLPTANNNSKRGTANLKSDMAAAMGMKADFAPNPATAWTEIDFTLPAEEKRATLVITNALGVNVMTIELIGNHGRKTLFLENLPSGVYTYFIRCGEYVVTGKLMKK